MSQPTPPAYVLNSGGPLAAAPGQQVTVQVSAVAIVSGAMGSTVSIDWGDWTPPTALTLPASSPWSANASHTYLSNGTFHVTATGPAGPTASLSPFAYVVDDAGARPV